MRASRLTLGQREQLCLDLEAGGKISNIGRKFGLSKSHASYVYHRLRGFSLRYYRQMQWLIQEFHAKIETLDDLLMIVIE